MKNQLAASEPADRRRHRRADATDGGGDHDEKEVEEQVAGQTERAAEAGEGEGQQGHAQQDDQPPDAPPAGRDGRQATATTRGRWAARRRARATLITCTSSDPARRRTSLITDPRSSSAQRERPLAPSTSCVACSRLGEVGQRRRRRRCRRLLVDAAEVLQRADGAGRGDRSARWPGRRWPARARRSARLSRGAAMRAARRMRCSPLGAPVMATTTRSRVSQASRDAVGGLVVLEGVVDLVGHPHAAPARAARRGCPTRK